ncbi:MAG: adenylosuccinate synthase [Polyangiales bacterium]
MPGLAVIGAQWGDEGKGKIVDLLTEHADLVVRYAGGPNAGHTLVVPNAAGGHDKIVVRLVPSGILRPDVKCVLGPGMVVDPQALIGELDELAARKVFDDRTGGARLLLSDRAHLILPYHTLVDGLREKGAYSVGTTKRGIGPAYEDKARRSGVHVGALRDLPKMARHVARALDAWAPTIVALGAAVPTPEEIVAHVAPLAARLLPLIGDASVCVDAAIRADRRVIFEGAQGTLLDLDHGTYPYVTSSTAVAGGACAGSGVGPTPLDRVVGITKAYTTRVGGGPFPTELEGALADRLRTAGGEFGAVTGRPRRCGWLDLPGLRYARRVNGLTDLVVTKLDVLSELDELQLCVAYDTPSGRVRELPIGELDRATPVYETMRGWRTSLLGARTLDALPAAARSYVERIAREVEAPLAIVSVGPQREATIALTDLFA